MTYSNKLVKYLLRYLIAVNNNMCFLRPLRVKKVLKDGVLLENQIEARLDKNAKNLRTNDLVIVYGNLVIEKLDNKNENKQSN